MSQEGLCYLAQIAESMFFGTLNLGEYKLRSSGSTDLHCPFFTTISRNLRCQPPQDMGALSSLACVSLAKVHPLLL